MRLEFAVIRAILGDGEVVLVLMTELVILMFGQCHTNLDSN